MFEWLAAVVCVDSTCDGENENPAGCWRAGLVDGIGADLLEMVLQKRAISISYRQIPIGH
jgi:hypothetical protein